MTSRMQKFCARRAKTSETASRSLQCRVICQHITKEGKFGCMVNLVNLKQNLLFERPDGPFLPRKRSFTASELRDLIVSAT
jgi:hypothetical protein